MHILVNVVQATGVQENHIMGGDLFDKAVFTLTMCLEILLGMYLQQFFHWYGNVTRMHKWYGREWRGGQLDRGLEGISEIGWWCTSQLSTVSLCSVSEACWATLLFSWPRSLDTTSRKAKSSTSLCRDSERQKTWHVCSCIPCIVLSFMLLKTYAQNVFDTILEKDT